MVETIPPDLERGIRKLMEALESLCPPKVCRKGETMTVFFESWDQEDEADDDGIEELVQRELEALATDLGDTNEEGLDHDQAEAVEKAAVQLSELPEALATVRQARDSLRKGGSSSSGGAAVAPPQRSGRGRGRSIAGRKPGRRGKFQPIKDTLDKRKKNSQCRVCDGWGHWAGDPECPGAREVQEVTAGVDLDDDGMENLAIEMAFPLAVLQNTVVVGPSPMHKKGAVDSACARSVMGTLWWDDYYGHLKALGLDKLVTFESVHENFKFGDGGTKDSDTQVKFPVAAAKVPHFIKATCWRFQDRSTGHYMLELNPDAYHVLRSHSRDKNVTDELPRRLRPRTTGVKAASRIMALVCGAQAATPTCGQGLGPAAEAVKGVTSVSQTQNLEKEQNLAGITKAKTLQDHNVSTNKVKKLIQLEHADQVHGQAVAAIRRGRPRNYSLFELACEPNSLLGREFNATGRDRAFRVHLPQCDLRRKQTVEGILVKIMKEKKLGRIPVVSISIPCTPWCTYQRPWNSRTLAQRVRLRMARQDNSNILRNILWLLKELRPHAIPTGFELPFVSDIWNDRYMPKELFHIQQIIGLRAVFDGCRYGIKTSKGKPIRKRFKVLTKHQPIVEKLYEKCDGTHVHAKVFGGKDLNQTGCYTVSLVKDIASGLRTVRRGYDVLPVAHDTEVTARAKAVLDAMDPAERVVKLVHTITGHPTSASLARAIRLQGGSAKAIAAAEAHRCPDCERRKPPDISTPADLRSKFREFGDGVATDLMTLADIKGHQAQLQNNVDMATTFQLVAPQAARPSSHNFSIGDQVFYWRGLNKAKKMWNFKWHGPRVFIGYKGNNVWVSHRNATLKCSPKHIRPALPEECVPWNEIFDALAHDNEPEFQEDTPYMEDPPGTDTDYYDMTADDEEIPGPTHTYPTAGRRQTGKRPGQFGYRREGTAEEETPGPPPDFDATLGPDQLADPEAKRPRFAPEPESETPVEMPPAQPRHPDHDPVPVEPEAPCEQPMTDQEQHQRAHSSQVPDAFDPDLYEQEPETPWVHQGAPDLDEDLDVDEIGKSPRSPGLTSIMELSLKESVDFDYSNLYSTRFRRVDLVGKSRSKELTIRNLTGGNQVKMRKAMASEWDKWLAFNAVRFCSREELAQLKRKKPQLKVVGTRFALTEKDTDTFKARLVVQGCQENDLGIRTDALTGSRDAFWLTAGFAAQHGWDGAFFDAESAYLQAEGMDRDLTIKMSMENPPPGTVPGQIFFATGSIYGAKDAGRAWYSYLKSVLSGSHIHESKLERGWYYLAHQGEIILVIHSYVDDMFFAWKQSNTYVLKIMPELEKRLHLAKKVGDVDYLGTRVQMTLGFINVTQEKAIRAIEHIPIHENRTKMPESRPDAACNQNLAAQRISKLKVQDLINLNQLVTELKQNPTLGLVFYGDSAFANAEGERSQCGLVGGLTHKPEEVAQGTFSELIPLTWCSGRVPRVVRSTLSAEAYDISEASEYAEWYRQVLTELKMAAKLGGPPKLKDVERQADNIKMTTFTDSKNLEETVEKDAGVVQETRLRIVVSMLRETFAPTASILRWILTHTMVTDALTKVMHAGMLMAFMSGRDVKFSAPAPKSKKLVPLLTLATRAIPGASFDLWPMERTSNDRHSQDLTIVQSCSREGYAVSWLYYLQGVAFGIMLTLVCMMVYVVMQKMLSLQSGTPEADRQMETMMVRPAMQRKTQQVDYPMQFKTQQVDCPMDIKIKPKHGKDVGHMIQVRDVMTMSQTTYVRGFAPGPRRHKPVHNFEGYVFCGQPYDRVSTP
ncbi:unnamed protein product [Prorocentrum cordatum]|uniref:Reverse transcriptase Ty1/copia-type domain-containing protein n=1 Tax=Prorocentrum cordatum TaxID=2364126 RepID=A0ABN9RJI3_9DINO|nr:unnamed protein product [Polarella glacialis]